MCGIAFIWDKKNQLTSVPIELMVDALKHRGPDGSDYTTKHFQNSTLYIGHTHLNILSKKGDEQQPYTNDEYSLTYNGAIYNYKEIEPGAVSDSEAVFLSLQKIGINDTLSKLNGMFGFVFIDQDTIYIARDRMGIKPIYYYNNDDYLIVASETKAIFATGLVERTINKVEAKHFLRYKHTSVGSTIFENIHEVLPHTYLKVNSLGLEEVQYFGSNYQESSLEELIRNSVVSQLQTNGNKVGLFLSGGIDSTLILDEMSTLFTSDQLITLSIDVNNTLDSSYSKKASEQFGSAHHTVSLDTIQIGNSFHKDEEPIGDIASITTNLLAKKAKELGIDVILSGAGADELFAGYNRHLAFDKLLHNKWIPYRLLKYIPFSFSDTFRKYKKLGESIGNTYTETFLNFTALRWNTDVPKVGQIDTLKEALNHDTYNFLVKDVLSMTDKMCMQNGVECRVPFLDHNIVNFAQQYPNHLAKGTKTLLKTLLTKKGGATYVNRKKEGFGFSIHSEDVALVLGLHKQEPIFEYIDYKEVMNKATLHLEKKDNFSQELVALLILRHTLL